MTDVRRTGEGTGPQVLVVGAGPVGLTAAHELARHGVRVRLVDAAPGPARTSRALATHARTLETYDQMGVLGGLLPRGQRVEHFTLHQNGRRLVRFDTDYSRLPTRFPFTLMVDQVVTEEVLRTAAARRGVEPEWGVSLEGFEDRGSEVAVRLRHPDGTVEETAAGWLVGCDGGHSTVRRQLGLPLVGESSETWLIADAVVDCDLPRDSIHWMRTRAGTVMLVPFPDPGKWRLLDTADVSYDGDDEAVARRFAAKIEAGTGRPVRVSAPSWVSVFTIQQRMIPTMRSGRCFVAGDAAHVHSPASGQGMNTGVQDAFNLAWKLAAVLHGTAGEELLDSYGTERVPVGAALLRSTRFATVLVQLRSRLAAAALRGVFTVVRSLPPLKSRIQRKIMGGMSALDLRYDGSPVTLPAAAAAQPAPGGRAARVTGETLARSEGWRRLVAELREPGWLLLAFAPYGGAALDRIADAYRSGLRVRVVPSGTGSAAVGPGTLADPGGMLADGLGAGPGDWLLVRPDGYVAARGGPAGGPGPEAALTALGLRPSPAEAPRPVAPGVGGGRGEEL
ncbi:FAD-dependent oxidoreductase [Streptacidiphilus sp. ASG 303]|uniref:FAD-dependent oxidoreductase n=1 Tax=Streptacidiphilus sp. ASG 303 TaxID=2896847 RepID=UPI001E482ABA|nr:FAD-dependent oxidoreductase [Streptacidiphilus sp. ASG 303]MCD0485151.1 FAD-dependent oxidoreductase [Streptacidiphilus sp. ASG 303]